eukprot:g7343.t1
MVRIMIKGGVWKNTEDEILKAAVMKYGKNQWARVASLLSRKSPKQCKARWRLRPGEIDPHPETKPARPDPIDMDEDEKEMLSEARARLANTRGKKAKRKAREKQLEEAKRLATLQKRRELKAAGIEKTANRKRRKYIDYGKEIPFQRNAPAGFYDVTEETQIAKRARQDPSFSTKFLQDLEDKRRDEEDERSRKKDEAKIKKMMKANLPQQILAVNAQNDPIPIRRRTELSLPAPQVSDGELEELVKMGAQAQAHAAGGSTSALLGDYSEAMPTPTPMRTPATPAGEDVVMQEARNLAAITSGQTPLLGGESPSLQEGTGFGGAAPRQNRMTTPSAMGAAGGAGAAGVGGSTPVPGTPSTALVKAEAARLVEHDCAAYPAASAIAAAAAAAAAAAGADDGADGAAGKKKKRKKKRKAEAAAAAAMASGAIPEIESFEEEELTNARLMVEQEAEDNEELPSLDEFNAAWEACFSEWAYFPSRNAYGRISTATKADRIESAKHRFEALRVEADAQAGRARKLEARLKMRLGGYAKVFDQRATGLNRIHKEVENAQIETSCHKMLLNTETAAIPRRVAGAEAAAAAEAEAEELLQADYQRLVQEKAAILEARAAARKEASAKKTAEKRARRALEEKEMLLEEEEERKKNASGEGTAKSSTTEATAMMVDGEGAPVVAASS